MKTSVKVGATVGLVIVANALFSIWIAADVALLGRDLSVVDGMSIGATVMMGSSLVIMNRVKEMIKNDE